MTHVSNNQQDNIEDLFKYHAPTEIKRMRHEELRAAGLVFAQALMACTPRCADQSAAIRKIREAVMLGNSAIALEEDVIAPT